MGPLAAAESVVFNALNLKGRASRSEYWWWFSIQPLILFALAYFDYLSLVNAEQPSINPLSYTSFLFALVTLVPNFTVTIRRLHDTGRSGFWYLVVMIPIVGPFWFLFLMLCPSEQNDNIYGAPWKKSGSWSGKSEGKSDPMQGYAVLNHLNDKPSPEVIEARKQEIREYYKTRVLQSQS